MSVLVIGQRLCSKEVGLRAAIERAADKPLFMNRRPAPQEILTLLSGVPRCVLVESHDDVRYINQVLRGNAAYFGVPLIAVVEQVSDRTMLELHSLGADDVVPVHDLGGLTRRLGALSSFDPQARTAIMQGTCLLAHADPYRRQIFGRLLRQAGFDISFAGSSDEALAVAERSPPKVAVISDALPPNGGRSALAKLSEHWVGRMPAVLLTAGGQSGSLSSHGWPTVPEEAPPDDLLFVINEQLKPRELIETRASQRLLHATMCGFRVAGTIESRFGLTYNISGEGLYVRTFDAPSHGASVWLEFLPPGSFQAVHLRGKVVWTRALATGAHGAAPPGFGVRLSPDECPPQDIALYAQRYALLRRMLAG
jgi:CheY-like chemotaxis protein